MIVMLPWVGNSASFYAGVSGVERHHRICRSICLSIYLPTYPCICPYTCLSIYVVFDLPIYHPSINPSIRLSIYLSTYLSIYLSIYLPIYISIYKPSIHGLGLGQRTESKAASDAAAGCLPSGAEAATRLSKLLPTGV